MDNNMVSGDVLRQLMQDIPTKKLSLVRHKLTKDQLEPIRQTMITKKDLQQLYLTQNDLTDDALGMLADGIAANTGL